MYYASATRTPNSKLTSLSSSRRSCKKKSLTPQSSVMQSKKKSMNSKKTRRTLQRGVVSPRGIQKIHSQIDSIDAELRLLDVEYEQADKLLNQLNFGMETSQLRLQHNKVNFTITVMSSHWKLTRGKCRKLKLPSA